MSIILTTLNGGHNGGQRQSYSYQHAICPFIGFLGFRVLLCTQFQSKMISNHDSGDYFHLQKQRSEWRSDLKLFPCDMSFHWFVHVHRMKQRNCKYIIFNENYSRRVLIDFKVIDNSYILKLNEVLKFSSTKEKFSCF